MDINNDIIHYYKKKSEDARQKPLFFKEEEENNNQKNTEEQNNNKPPSDYRNQRGNSFDADSREIFNRKRNPSHNKAPKEGLTVISDDFSSIKSKGFSFG